MKKIIFFTLAIGLLSCRKNDIPVNQKPDIEQEILSKTSYQEISQLPREKIVGLIKYLDNAPQAKRELIFSKLTSLGQAQSAPKVRKSTQSTEDDPTIEDLIDVIPIYGGPDPDDNMEIPPSDGLEGPFSGLPFYYKWKLIKQIAGLWYVETKDYFALIDQGSGAPPTRYTIGKLEHKTSYIIGFAPGVSWYDVGDENYAGQYFAYLKTNGVMVAMGINYPKSNDRYVNAGDIYTSDGKTYY